MINGFKNMCHENSIIIIKYQMIYIWKKYNYVMRNNITSISFISYNVWKWAVPQIVNCNLGYSGIRDSSQSNPEKAIPTYTVPFKQSHQES